ncbi:MAG: 30S ribosomal protein S12 methylthiotransferase RimO [Bacteroidaceae bacterium]|nr:30S ribosomal protein S12 methylthiotransferase RimO [Bacteroidaceae bacterium]
MTIDVITMGCSKNLVDSEQLLFRLRTAGYRVYHNPERLHHGIAVVNTCGFINDAKQESIDMILRLVALKEQGWLYKVLVMGCLSERFYKELKKEIQGVDKYYGKFNWKAMVKDLAKESMINPQSAMLNGQWKMINTKHNPRILTTPNHYAYVKISEGCDRHCAYCAIPLMTGRHKSRPIEEVLGEVRELVNKGVTEFQIIAQELTYYGIDLYGKRRIAELVERIAKIKGTKWIRLHYAYPNDFPLDLLRVMREHINVCKYLDIALQHSSDAILSRMHRNITSKEQRELIDTIRREVPGIVLRTTFMVGYPGETEEDFRNLIEFVKYVRFERMGAFAYSEEEGTKAAENYPDDVPEDVKQQRLSELMAVQQEISEEIAATRVGQKLRVVIEGKEGDYYIGRTEYDSPEVDGVVYVSVPEGRKLRRGSFYDVKITDANEFDLFGTL